jgi:dTDP-4-dehydrorhamnose 3,5-epimerase-like enzyme
MQLDYITVPSFGDSRGNICILEKGSLPFNIKRIYYIYNTPANSTRGVHGHKKLSQVLLCMHGSVQVTIHDGIKKRRFKLSNPTKGLFIPKGHWREVKFLEPGSVLCVLASRPFEKSDYIYSLEEFLAWRTKSKT